MANKLLTDIKGLLEHYFSEQLGEGACDDIAEEILAKVHKGASITSPEARMDRPELREKIAREMYNYLGNSHLTWNTCGVRGKYRCIADQLLVLIPTEEEIRKQERERIIDWGDENCPHREQNGWHLKHYCPKCWQALKEGA